MATNVFARRLVALGACASLAVFTTAMVAGPAFASKGKSKKHTTTTTSKKKKKGTTVTTKAGAKGSTSLATEVKKIETSVKGEKTATFIATFTLKTTSTGTSKTTAATKKITFAQASGGKSLFKTTSGTIIDNGTETLYCSKTGSTTDATTGGTSSGTSSSSPGGTTCFKSTTADPLAGMLDLFSATSALGFFSGAAEEAEAKVAGVTISYSSGTYAGLASKCVTVTSKEGTAKAGGKYCVANVGILDYWSTSGNSAMLTKYSSSVPASTFTPPAGATVVTEPAA